MDPSLNPAITGLKSAGGGDPARLPAHAPSFELGIERFDLIGPVNKRDILGPIDPNDPRADKLHLLREIVLLTKHSMAAMNRESRAIPPDSTEHLLKLLTAPSAHTVVLRAPIALENGSFLQDQVVGYGLVVLDKESIPDLADIPPALLQEEQVGRFIRLFLTDDARLALPRGLALKAIIDHVRDLAGDIPLLGKVLVGPESLAPRWLEAMTALVRSGFDDVGFAHSETFQHGALEVPLDFRWFIFPPRSDIALARQAARAEYFKGLEERIQRRLAWSAPHFPPDSSLLACFSRERDSYDLARLYPGNSVINVELGSKPAERLRNMRTHRWDQNGRGDYFDPETIDGIFCSSILPDAAHIPAPGPREAVESFLKQQCAALKNGQRIVVRDTINPDGPDQVLLELSTSDGAAQGTPRQLSSAARFEAFFQEIRNEPWLTDADREFARVSGGAAGFERFKISYRMASEYMLKMEYLKNDWELEVKRPYCLNSAVERQAIIVAAGCRIVESAAERNSWISSNWWRGRARILTVDGTELEPPPTSHIIVAEKVAPDGSFGLSLRESTTTDPKFLTVARYRLRDPASGEVVEERELALRPNPTLDVIPYFMARGELHVLAKKDYPRPIVLNGSAPLDGEAHGPYLTEQIAAIVDPRALDNPVRLIGQVSRILFERGGISHLNVRSLGALNRYFTAPENVDEQVSAIDVEIEPCLGHLFRPHGVSNLSTSGVVQPFSATRILQACQVGGMRDSRLERKIYELLQRLDLPVGLWLGEKLALAEQSAADIKPSAFSTILETPPRKPFERTSIGTDGFFETTRSVYDETDSSGRALGSVELEQVRPRPATGLSTNIAAVLPVVRVGPGRSASEFLVGLNIWDMPAAQEHNDSSELATALAYRLPSSCATSLAAGAEVARVMQGLNIRSITRLGESYFASPGVTPDLIYPMVAEVEPLSASGSALKWVSLADLLQHAPKIQDGNLLTLVYRTAHALGLLKTS